MIRYNPLILCALACFFAFPALGKSRAVHSVGNRLQDKAATAQQLESRLRPRLHSKSQHRKGIAKTDDSAGSFTQADIFALAKQWDHLSTEFKQDYLAATQIPTNYAKHVSPGGHFEVYYTTAGSDAVDPKDTIGYSASDWRIKTDASNGIPDYVDEVAWSLDTAWSLEIDKFGFKAPYGLKSSQFPSDRYKVLICQQGLDYYGLTYISGKHPTDSVGFSSYMEIRNEWAGWNLSPVIDYETHPEKGIRITCAHEFFHAIQYAMSWNVDGGIYLDSYPITWLEGTAVAMEELCHGYVNDYTQYLDDFFDDPTHSMLDSTYDGITEYKNALIALFLYYEALETPGIDLIKTVFENNADSPIDFYDNLPTAAAELGADWSDILNRFFSSSYYTGSRAATWPMLPDAPVFDRWSRSVDDALGGKALVKSVAPYGMQLFTFRGATASADSLTMSFVGELPKNATPDHGWGLRVLLQPGTGKDTMIVLAVDSTGELTTTLKTIDPIREAMVFVSNSHADTNRSAAVVFTPHGFPSGIINRVSTVTARYTGPWRASLYSPNGRLVAERTVHNVTPDALGTFAKGLGLARGTYLARLVPIGNSAKAFNTGMRKSMLFNIAP